MQVVGYYQANELCDDMELGPFGKTIAEKIRAQCKHATVLLVRGHAKAELSVHQYCCVHKYCLLCASPMAAS